MAAEIRLPHQKLLAYQVGLELIRHVREMKVSDARLHDQIARASKAVCLNIAEAVGRLSDADRKRVYAIARGECCETAAAIDIALAMSECEVESGRAALEAAGRVYALLTGLIRRPGNDTRGPKLDEHDPHHDHQHQHKPDHENEDEHEHDSGT